ncbi:MAG TPA: carboxypeptidase regulatory-like domain-containing protein [Planctomycetes bacterium]|nr:carboxypeptidase regulatory-like domain-containing protein [Planctomycetota bacterium]
MRSLFTSGILLLGITASAALAGDLERACNGAGTMFIEHWPGSAPSPLLTPVFYTDPLGTAAPTFGPGLPDITCGSTGTVATSAGLQSLVNAANAWSNLTSPSAPGTVISTFSIDLSQVVNGPGHNISAPAGTAANMLPTQISPSDMINMVTLWEPASTFAAAGGPMALAITAVTTTSTAVITDADVMVNCFAQQSPGVFMYSFVENNAQLGGWVATDANYQAQTGAMTTPSTGVIDLQGTLTHELGHLAGLGHSLVDSATFPFGSLSPTMFPLATGSGQFAQTVFLGQTICLPGQPLSTGFLDSGNTASLALFGETASTLELDDVLALARGYPTAALMDPTNAAHGSISGVVLDGTGAAITSAHVVAFEASDPNGKRVSTFSYNGGYVFYGLPPGNWYVEVEPVDITGYFSGLSTPSFVTPFGPSPVGLRSCVTPINFVPEFWNVGDAATEGPAEADPITIAPYTPQNPGANTATADVFVDIFSPAPLQACLGSATGAGCTGPLSSRGVLVRQLSRVLGPNNFQVQVNGGTSYAGALCYLSIDLNQAAIALNAPWLSASPQLQVLPVAVPGQPLPLVVSGVCNAAGVATFQFPFILGQQGYNVFLQGVLLSVSGGQVGNGMLTNSVNLLIQGP